MGLVDYYWLYDVKRPRNPTTDFAGSLTKSVVESLYHDLQARVAEHRAANG